ncbi:MAG: hypothetical protein AB1861_05665 [Cyanobacteriota bacterium]
MTILLGKKVTRVESFALLFTGCLLKSLQAKLFGDPPQLGIFKFQEMGGFILKPLAGDRVFSAKQACHQLFFVKSKPVRKNIFINKQKYLCSFY